MTTRQQKQQQLNNINTAERKQTFNQRNLENSLTFYLNLSKVCMLYSVQWLYLESIVREYEFYIFFLKIQKTRHFKFFWSGISKKT